MQPSRPSGPCGRVYHKVLFDQKVVEGLQDRRNKLIAQEAQIRSDLRLKDRLTSVLLFEPGVLMAFGVIGGAWLAAAHVLPRWGLMTRDQSAQCMAFGSQMVVVATVGAMGRWFMKPGLDRVLGERHAAAQIKLERLETRKRALTNALTGSSPAGAT